MNWHVFGKAFLCETAVLDSIFYPGTVSIPETAALFSEKHYVFHFSGTAVPVILLCVSCCCTENLPDNGYNLCRGLPKPLLFMCKSQCMETAFPVLFHF